MKHDKLTCDLCLAGRDDLCLIREKTISEFNDANNRLGDFKDFQDVKEKRRLYEIEQSNITKRSPV